MPKTCHLPLLRSVQRDEWPNIVKPNDSRLNIMVSKYEVISSRLNIVESHFCDDGFNGISHSRNKINRSQIFSGFCNVNFSRFNSSASTDHSHLKARFSGPPKHFTPCLNVIWPMTLRVALAAFQL